MHSTEQHAADGERTSFGFREVKTADKQRLVDDVFDAVAGRYDLMNDLMSGGVHRLWKNAMIDWLAPRPGMHLLDVAGGTGDIARRFLDRVHGDGRVTVCDINAEMMTVGRDRTIDAGMVHDIEWVCGDAEQLPLPDRSVDAYTIAFGIRNVTHVDAALREAHRVLKTGGRFLCLEFSHVALPGLSELYDTFSFKVLPWLGDTVAGDREAYQYLIESIRRFPDQDTFAAMIADAGFGRVKYRNQSGGIAALHSAWRI